MKKIVFYLAAITFLVACHKGEENLITEEDGVLYEVSFGISNVEVSSGTLKSKPIYDPTKDRNLDITLFIVSEDDLARDPYVFRYNKSYNDVKSPTGAEIKVCLPQGNYKVYAFAGSNILNPGDTDNAGLHINFDKDLALTTVENLDAGLDTEMEFWCGNLIECGGATTETLTVSGNTTGKINLKQEFSVIRWEVSGLGVDNRVLLSNQILKTYAYKYETQDQEKTSNVISYDQTLEIDQDGNGMVDSADENIENIGGQATFVYELFTFPGQLAASETFTQEITFEKNTGAAPGLWEFQSTKTATIDVIETRKIYTLKLSSTALNIQLEHEDFDEGTFTWD